MVELISTFVQPTAADEASASTCVRISAQPRRRGRGREQQREGKGYGSPAIHEGLLYLGVLLPGVLGNLGLGRIGSPLTVLLF